MSYSLLELLPPNANQNDINEFQNIPYILRSVYNIPVINFKRAKPQKAFRCCLWSAHWLCSMAPLCYEQAGVRHSDLDACVGLWLIVLNL